MTKVYCLFVGSYEDRYLESIYTTLEAAQAAPHTGHKPKWEKGPTYWWCKWQRRTRKWMQVPITFETRRIPVVDGVARLPDGRKIDTDAKFVDVPVMPKGIIPPFTESVASCDYSIEEHDLRG